MKKLIALAGVGSVVLLLTNGCTSTRGTPSALPTINANMDKNDYQVGPATQGSTHVDSYLGGFVKILDQDNVSVLGFPFYEVKTAGPQDEKTFVGLFQEFMTGQAEARGRAYFKALEAAPDADTIIPKSYIIKDRIIFPIIYSEYDVTFQGKALTYKSHN